VDGLVTRACYLLFGSKPIFVTIVYFLFLSLVYFLSKRLKNKGLFLFIISITPAILYLIRLLLNDYFLSDDFDHFVLVSKYSYLEIFIKGITANGIWAFHRLFTSFWLFKLIYSIFKTNYYAFAIVNFCLHVLNLYLLTLILKKIFKNIYVTSILVFIMSFHYLTWISNIHELLAGFFFLSTFYLTFNSKFKVLPIITYILGIYSKEIVFIFPLCYVLFLVFYNNYVKKIDLRKLTLGLKPFFVIFLLYLVVFIKDFYKFTNFTTGSGYNLIFKLNTLFSHLSFYLTDRIPFILGIFGFLVFTLIVLLYDIVKKKFIIIPLYISFIALIFPVLLLSKNTSYYSYIPSFFLIIIIGVFLNKFEKMSTLLSLVFASLLLVFVFKTNIKLQENCFLIQFPRIHPRRQAVEDILKGKENNSDEAKWFLENNYLPYFKVK
jgi:hypothetical protein